MKRGRTPNSTISPRTMGILTQIQSERTYASIGSEFGVSRQRIEQIARKHDLREKRRNQRENERAFFEAFKRRKRDAFLAKKTRIQEAVQAVRDGLNPTDAAIKFRVKYMSLCNAMQNAGVKPKNHRAMQRCSVIQLTKLTALLTTTDMDDDEISWATGIGYSTVKNHRRQLNIGNKNGVE